MTRPTSTTEPQEIDQARANLAADLVLEISDAIAAYGRASGDMALSYVDRSRADTCQANLAARTADLVRLIGELSRLAGGSR